MISYVKGKLEYIGDDFILVEANGIGYQIFVSSKTVAALPQIHSMLQIFTYMNVREDGISLFGFSTMEELSVFHRLILVSGIGPKGALGFLAALEPQEIVMAVLSEDIKTLMKAPGVGKKTAQRMVLDLKDKFRTEEFLPAFMDEDTKGFFQEEKGETGEAKHLAIEALAALGYSRSEAAQAVSKVYQDGIETEQLLKLALKKMI